MDQLKRFRLLIGALVLAGMVGLTWWAVSTKTGETPAQAGAVPTLPEIDRAALTQLEIRRPEDDAPIRLVREGSAWRIAAPIEAAAAQTTIDTALDKLADLDVTRVAATRAQHHARLEVDAEHAVRVTAKAGDRTVIDLWVGAFRSGSTMIRLEGQQEVLAVRGSIKFAFNKPVRDWRDRAILDLEAESLREATFTNANGVFRFRKNGENWEQVVEPAAPDAQAGAPAAEGAPAPAGAIERFSASRLSTNLSSLARLRASDFAAADVTVESAGLGDSAPRVVLVTGEGESAQSVTLRIGNEAEEGNRYVMREGNDTIFVVSRFMAERLVPNVAAFQEAEPGAEGEAPAEPAEGEIPSMPGGGGQIPPELMEQIQRQLQQQGAAAAGGGE
jgi:hypothetical protein